MTAARSRPVAVSPATKWSVAVGAYTLLCAVVVLVGIRSVASLVADVLALPSASVLWLAAPVPVVGALAWWAAVERPGRYTYGRGVVAGLATALGTVLVWMLWGAVVWGPELVLLGWPLVVAVVVPAVPAGLLAGVPATYARRRLGGGEHPAATG